MPCLQHGSDELLAVIYANLRGGVESGAHKTIIAVMIMQLLGGMRAQQFLARYWQKKPLLVRHAIPDFNGILQMSELFRPAVLQPGRSPRSTHDHAVPQGHVFLNGERFIAPRSARSALVRLADERRLDGIRDSDRELCDFLYRWYLVGWLHPGSVDGLRTL